MHNFSNNIFEINAFSNKHTISQSNLKVELYHNNLSMEKLTQIKSDIVNTFLYFKECFCSKENQFEDTFELRLNIFDSKNEYNNFAKSTDNVANIYLDDGINTISVLQDELIHNFLHYATKGNVDEIPYVLKEGIRSYMKDRGDTVKENANYAKFQSVNLSEIFNIHNKNIDVSKVGYTLVAFLKEKEPHLIDKILESLRYENRALIKEAFESYLKRYEKDFSDWISSKTFESLIDKIGNEVSQDTFFSKVEIIKIPGSKLEVELHHNTLDKQKIEKFRSDIVNTFEDFKESFNLRESTTGPYKFKLHVFDNIDSYHKNVSEVSGFKISSNNIGIAIPKFNNTNYIADIFISQDEDKLFVLKHELVHGLTYAAAEGKGVWFPKAIMEGIATFIDRKGKYNHINSDIEYTKSKNLSLSEIYKLTKSSNVDYYAAGNVLVMFLEEKAPNLIDRMLKFLHNGNHALIKEAFENMLKYYEKDFSDWISSKTFESPIDKIDTEISQDTFFSKIEIIKIPESRLEVELHHNTLDKQKIEKFRSDIVNTFKDFQKSFYLIEYNNGPYKIKCHIFDSKESYKKDGSKVFDLDISTSAGLTKNSIGYQDDYVAKIYFGQSKEDSRILKHEVVHGLTFYVAGENSWVIPTVIIEGIARFIEHKKDLNFNNLQIEKVKSLDLSLSEICELTYNDGRKTYEAGHVLVMFLEEKHPHLIDNALYDLRYKNSALVRDELEDKLKYYEKDFSNWLDHNYLLNLYNNIEENIIYTTDNASNIGYY